MRLVSANLNHITAWSEANLPRTAELLRETNAEIIAIQECPSQTTLDAVATALGFDGCLGDEAHGNVRYAPARFFTALLWSRSLTEIRKTDTYSAKTWHGYTTATLDHSDWPCPLSVISAHLNPFSSQIALGEAQLLQSRLQRSGQPAVLLADVNQIPLVGPEPDWEEIAPHVRAARTMFDVDRPDEIKADRRVGLVFHRAGFTDVAAAMYERTRNEAYLEPTGVHGGSRVDQIWTTKELTPTIRGYERLDHQGLTDHHPIAADLDLSAVARFHDSQGQSFYPEEQTSPP